MQKETIGMQDVDDDEMNSDDINFVKITFKEKSELDKKGLSTMVA